jgi:hypothetical protein
MQGKLLVIERKAGGGSSKVGALARGERES